MHKLELVRLLTGKEAEAITRTLAMMAYNPAIGRVREKGGVEGLLNSCSKQSRSSMGSSRATILRQQGRKFF